MTGRIDQFLEENADGYGVQDYDAAVDALVAIGQLSAERAEMCKAEAARLRASRVNFQGPYDANVEARASQLLEDLFAPVRPRSSDAWDPAVYHRYQEALSTLTGIGALSLERARPWLDRQRETLMPPGGWPEPEPDPEMPFVAAELSAVVVGPAVRRDGVCVTCLELYDDCVIVRFHQLLPEEPPDPVERRKYLKTPFELEDDVGTVYQPAVIPTSRGCKPREIRGWPRVLVGWQAFLPAAPLVARTFSVGWREHRFDLSVGASRVP